MRVIFRCQRTENEIRVYEDVEDCAPIEDTPSHVLILKNGKKILHPVEGFIIEIEEE